VAQAPDVRLGVFETLLVWNGRPGELDAHLARLRRSVERLYDGSVPPGLERSISLLAERRASEATRLRILYDPATGETSLEWSPAPENLLDTGEHAPLETRRLVLAAGLGPHKWRDRSLLEDPLDARAPLLFDAGGCLLEAAHANVFASEPGRIATPPLDGRILPGVTRSRVLDLAAAVGLGVEEAPLTPARLARTDELFLTSSVRGVQRVAGCEGVGEWGDAGNAAQLSAELARVWRRHP
jgi:para-aminobenzoate synthetase/4-amino-4-deoxychorismate lyase